MSAPSMEARAHRLVSAVCGLVLGGFVGATSLAAVGVGLSPLAAPIGVDLAHAVLFGGVGWTVGGYVGWAVGARRTR